MTITVKCESCGAKYRVPDNVAGKRAKCSKCAAVILVPSGDTDHAGGETISAARASQPMAAAPAAAPTKMAPAKMASPNVSPPTSSPANVSPVNGSPVNVAEPVAEGRRDPPRTVVSEQEILQAFQGEIPRVRTSATYKLGIFAVSVVMVLLPLVYIGLIGLVCYGVYYHLVHDIEMLGAAKGRGALMVLLAYLAPLVIGVILIFFMIKPLFARPSRDGRVRSLTRKEQPILFAFVDKLCESVHAPRPKQINIDCEVNASAGFRRGMISMVVGNDLVLTIGMPLVSGFTMRQFAGVLAHEFGHFSQGAGMRLTYVTRSISMWFTRVVYERDSWDEWLSSSTKGLDLRIGWVLYLAQFFVWLTRKILWVLMMIGHLVAGYMLRQMEFDADRYEARLAGSETFESTCRRLSMLNVGLQAAREDLGTFYREGRLADNLPRLIMENVEQLPESIVEQVNQAIDNSKTEKFDTHPADRDRIASAHREQAAGVFVLQRPASDLFRDYAELCRQATWDYYVGLFGPEFSESDMHPIDDMLRRREQIRGEKEALNRYFLGGFNLLRPIPLPSNKLGPPSDPKATARELKAARQQLDVLRANFVASFEDYDKADTQALEALAAQALQQAELKISADHFSIPLRTPEAVREALNATRQQRILNGEKLAEFERALGKRLVAALQLLFVGQVSQRIPDAAVRQRESAELLPILGKFDGLMETMLDMRNERTTLALLFGQLQEREATEAMINTIQQHTQGLHDRLAEIHKALDNLRYPFEHAKGEMKLSEYLLAAAPAVEDVGEVFEAAEQMLDRLVDVYARICGRLSGHAEAVESVLGLSPLEVPAEA